MNKHGAAHTQTWPKIYYLYLFKALFKLKFSNLSLKYQDRLIEISPGTLHPNLPLNACFLQNLSLKILLRLAFFPCLGAMITFSSLILFQISEKSCFLSCSPVHLHLHRGTLSEAYSVSVSFIFSLISFSTKIISSVTFQFLLEF